MSSQRPPGLVANATAVQASARRCNRALGRDVKVQEWTGRLACAMQSAVDMTNERFADRLGIAARTVAYWHSRQDSVPSLGNQRILSAFLENLPDAALNRLANAANRADIAEPVPVGSDPVAERVRTAADAITIDPLLIDGDFDSDSVEVLQEEMAVLARGGDKAAIDVFNVAKRLRDQARKLAERTRRPSVLADLYVVIGQGTALMASTAFDLGHWNESAALAQASARYANMAGHISLEAWTYGLQMTLANWRNEPDAALMYMKRGMRIAPDGEPRFRLRYIAARSHALMGDAGTVAALLADAEQDRADMERRPDDLSSSTGGEFAFGEARAAACAAAAWLDLKVGDEAVAYASVALDFFESLPAFRRPYSQINGTQIDIAAARLHMNDRDGARDALQSVLDLPVEKRNVSLTGRIAKVRNLLSLPPWNDDPEAHALADDVTAWAAETSARPLR
jgi:hypothetical protein